MSNRFLVTQSLLSSWQWSLVKDGGFEEFLKNLRREFIPTTPAMAAGIRFESRLNNVLNGEPIESEEEWYKPITTLCGTLKGSQQQVTASKYIVIDETEFVLYGKLDYLKAGIIYDTKFSKTYSVGKYLDSPQHPMYFAIVPEAYEFQYLICDGEEVYTETYRPNDIEPIERVIKHFMDYLEKTNLTKTYFSNWKSKF